jgi:hypothetical protein
MNVPLVIPGEDQMSRQSFQLRISYLGMDVPPVIPVEDFLPWDGCPTSHPSLGCDVPPVISVEDFLHLRMEAPPAIPVDPTLG